MKKKTMPKSKSSAKITVIGIGDGGINAIDRMIKIGMEGVEFVAIDTDTQVLNNSSADQLVQIGEKTTEGRGTGGNIELGKQTAEEATDKFEHHIAGSDMVFLTAGLGGGTGTGAMPVLASVSTSLDILTIGVVTTPFPFEGKVRAERATRGVNHLESLVDALIVVSNAQLLKSVPGKIPMTEAFQKADQVLQQGVQGISDLITYPGLINLDLADVRSVLKGAGRAVIGIGQGKGKNKVLEAAKTASSNPLLEEGSIKGAKRLILNVTGGKDLGIAELNNAADLIKDAVGTETNMVFGAVIDEKMKGKTRVTVIAADFRRGMSEEDTEPEMTEGPVDFADINVPTFIRRNKGRDQTT